MSSGTVIVLGYSKSKAVIAADSRESDNKGEYRDEACKIGVLNEDLVFAALGSARSTRREIILWDATREARAAFANTNRLAAESDGDFIDQVAHGWGMLLAAKIGENVQPEEGLAFSDDEILVDGVFIGVAGPQELHISHQVIRAKIINKIPHIAVDPTKIVTLSDSMQFHVAGEADVFDEFIAGNTERAKKWNADLKRDMRRKRDDGDVLKAIRLVDLTGAFGVDTVPHRPTVHLVGGKTDAVELHAGGKVRWVQSKPACR